MKFSELTALWNWEELINFRDLYESFCLWDKKRKLLTFGSDRNHIQDLDLNCEPYYCICGCFDLIGNMHPTECPTSLC